MKKLLIIAILISYSVASFGVQLNYFYCCGKLKTVSLALKAEDKDCKGKPVKGCCDNKTVSLKLKVDQEKTVEKDAIKFQILLSPAILHVSSFTSENIITTRGLNPLYRRPPPSILPSRQVLYCVFRI